MKEEDVIPDLFRNEFSKIIAVICKTYGLLNIQLAEDIVSDTFLIAAETWGSKGIPKHPKAWLYSVAKNKTVDHFRRTSTFNKKIKPILQNKPNTAIQEPNFSISNITDSQLQMLFVVCNPKLTTEAQITLALRILCGFGIQEIAIAFLTNKATINKRLGRAKKAFKEHNITLQPLQKPEIHNRVDSVLSVLYLLFNEGYYSSSSKQILQKELCIEAMRLNLMLLNQTATNLPKANALMALFCFHSSRFEERKNKHGELILFEDQNKKHWNYELIEKGNYYLNKSAEGDITKYHLEAGISYWHTNTTAGKEKWSQILKLYNQLLDLEYSPIIAMNKCYVLSKVNGNEEAIQEAQHLDLKQHHLYHCLMAELYGAKNRNKAIEHLNVALKLAETKAEKNLINIKLERAKT